MDKDAFLAGYMSKEAAPKVPGGGFWGGVGKAVGTAAGKTGGVLAEGIGGTAKWTMEQVKTMAAILALVPPAIGAVTGLAASKMTSPSAADEEALNALIEEQEVDRMLAETGRLTQAQRGKLKKDKEKQNERSLYLG